MNYTEVLSGVWVSDVQLLQNRDFMIDNQIDIILNCTQYYDFPSVEAQKIRLPFSPNVSDETNLQMLKQNKPQKQNHPFVSTSVSKHISMNLLQGVAYMCRHRKCSMSYSIAPRVLPQAGASSLDVEGWAN